MSRPGGSDWRLLFTYEAKTTALITRDSNATNGSALSLGMITRTVSGAFYPAGDANL